LEKLAGFYLRLKYLARAGLVRFGVSGFGFLETKNAKHGTLDESKQLTVNERMG
jgi:hypothetical protein